MKLQYSFHDDITCAKYYVLVLIVIEQENILLCDENVRNFLSYHLLNIIQ
jgi:hypothetical protein